MIKAIETQYKGYRFRSRLEARWAVFFDTMGIKWEYELEGYELANGEWYLPDFYLKNWDIFAEVKPGILSNSEFTKSNLLPKTCILLDTSHPDIVGYVIVPDIVDGEPMTYKKYLSGDDYGRVVLEESVYKKRLWFLLGEHITDYFLPKTIQSVEASLAWRFS